MTKITTWIKKPKLLALFGCMCCTACLLFSCNRKADYQPSQTQQSAPATPQYALNGPVIRVAALRDPNEIRVAASDAPARVFDARGQEVMRIAPNQECAVSMSGGNVLINGRPALDGTFVRIQSLNSDNFLQMAGAELAPQVRIQTDPKGGLVLIAELGLEDYLTGVLVGEVPVNRWHEEALKAQAVTSRSFALSQMRQRANEPYDVEATVMSQVFKPGHRNNPTVVKACQATRGLVLTCQGRYFPAYFHSTCGGQTSAVERIFPGQEAVPCLRGTSCPFCTASPSYTWHLRLSKEALRTKLSGSMDVAGAQIGQISSIEFLGGSGNPARAEQVRIHHSFGTATLPANRFRILAGAGELKSVQLTGLSDAGDAFEISGRGFGHGVGLCQYGSQGMALQGYSYEQILGFYFPGGELTKAYAAEVASK